MDAISQATDNWLELFVAMIFHVVPGQSLRSQLSASLEHVTIQGPPESKSVQLETAWLIIEVEEASVSLRLKSMASPLDG